MAGGEVARDIAVVPSGISIFLVRAASGVSRIGLVVRGEAGFSISSLLGVSAHQRSSLLGTISHRISISGRRTIGLPQRVSDVPSKRIGRVSVGIPTLSGRGRLPCLSGGGVLSRDVFVHRMVI